jgi:hypothetical protein
LSWTSLANLGLNILSHTSLGERPCTQNALQQTSTSISHARPRRTCLRPEPCRTPKAYQLCSTVLQFKTFVMIFGLQFTTRTEEREGGGARRASARAARWFITCAVWDSTGMHGRCHIRHAVAIMYILFGGEWTGHIFNPGIARWVLIWLSMRHVARCTSGS